MRTIDGPVEIQNNDRMFSITASDAVAVAVEARSTVATIRPRRRKPYRGYSERNVKRKFFRVIPEIVLWLRVFF